MDEICKTCINITPSVECVNCGLRHRNYKKKQSNTNTTTFIQEFPCEVGQEVHHYYNGEYNKGKVLYFTVGEEMYGNVSLNRESFFRSINLKEWNEVVFYSKEEYDRSRRK